MIVTLLEWCNTNGTIGQEIKSEWTGLDKDNNYIDISLITKGSGRKMKWRCKYGHEWIATINNRTSGHTGCPECYKNNIQDISNRTKVKSGINNLYTWCQNNGEYGKTLLLEWTGINKDGSKVDIHNVCAQSNKNMLWRCKHKHE